MKKIKLFIYLLSAVILILGILISVFLYVWTRNDYKVIQKEKIGIYTVVLYQLDPGARGSATVNLSIGFNPNLNERGNIYSAVIPGDSSNYFIIDKENKKIDFYINDYNSVQLIAKNNHKNFRITYHIKNSR